MKRDRPGLLLMLSTCTLAASAWGEALADDAPRPLEIRHGVKGRATIIFVVADGSAVKKGQLISELDSAPLRDRLINLEIDVKQKEAAVENAAKLREMGAIKKSTILVENESMVHQAKLDLKLAQNAMTFALANQRDAEEAGLIARRLRDFEIAVLTAQNALDDAMHKLDILTRFTVQRRALKAEAEIKKAESNQLRREADLNLAKMQVSDLRRQILSCKIMAPFDGTLEYSRLDGLPQATIREGAIIQGDQVLFLLKPAAKPESPDEKPSAVEVPDEKAVAKELERFQGKWVVTSITMLGNKLDDARLKQLGLEIEFDGNVQTMVGAGRQPRTATITLRPDRTPAEIDVTAMNPQGVSSTSLGIYTLNGDTLTICFNRGGGGVRPSKFVSEAETGEFLTVYERKKD